MDGEIEYIMKSRKEKMEIKRDQEFYTLEYHPKRGKKIKKEQIIIVLNKSLFIDLK